MGRNGSSSHNDDVLGRDIMTPDEVGHLDNKYCITFIRGCYPVLDLKYKTNEKEGFKTAMKIGPYKHRGTIIQRLQGTEKREGGRCERV